MVGNNRQINLAKRHKYPIFNSLHAVFFHRLLTFFFFFLKSSFQECQTFWIHIRTDVLSVLVWVQTVCKGYMYQLTTKVAASNERVKTKLQYLHKILSTLAST